MQPSYVVVMNPDVKKFVEGVNAMLSSGFVLVGGMSVCEADYIVNDEPQSGIVYHQAMIRMPKVAAAPTGLQIPRNMQ